MPPPDVKMSDMNFVQGNARRPACATRRLGRRRGGGRGAGTSARRLAAAAAEGGGAGVDGAGPAADQAAVRHASRAIDLDKGEIVWQIAHGETPDNVRNNPALKGLTIPRTGQAGIIGTLVTKTLVIAGESRVTTTSTGMRGAMLRAYDKATGKEVGAVFMPAPQSGSPMTYMLNGKQYIVVAVSGGNYSGELIAFKFPG